EWQRNQIVGQVPETAEQIHVRQILVLDADLAEKIHTQLEAGADFATIARRYDPATGGDLGWFPKGYLILADIEQAAFSLEPGQYSQVIPSAYGFHIVQVMERDPGRLLASEVRRTLQHKAMVTWLEDQKANSLIEILVP
ncbi:MAG: peptidylprolyl isomerase, partial [Anaerolineaceae bacterium]|nr:peptidylprolyl isomerase [Anaerolineaceae bacterium]